MSRNKRPSLAEFMENDDTNVVTLAQPVEAAPEVTEPVAEEAQAANGKPYKRVGLYLAPVVKREVDTIAFTHERKPHDLYLEAIDLLLKKYGRASISELEKKA